MKRGHGPTKQTLIGVHLSMHLMHSHSTITIQWAIFVGANFCGFKFHGSTGQPKDGTHDVDYVIYHVVATEHIDTVQNIIKS